MTRDILLTAALLLLASCTVEPLSDQIVLEDTLQTKVIQLSDEYITNSFLVKMDTDASAEDFAALERLGTVSAVFHSTPGKEELEKRFGLDRWYEVTLASDDALRSAVTAAAKLGSVALVQYNSIASKEVEGSPVYAAPDTKADGDAIFNDPMLANQWHYINNGDVSVSPSVYKGADINVKDVWTELTCGDPDIIVAVVDEGVKYNHPDLSANMWKNTAEVPNNGVDDDGNGYIDDIYGYNFVDNTGDISWAKDGDTGHATHCAGTIAAVNNNNKGVSGVAGGSGNNDGCRIMSCQIFSGNYGGTARQTANAIKYAADMGASIISCSFGYTSSMASDNDYIKKVGSVEIDAIHYFESCKGNNPVLTDGNIAIFAAGNENQSFAHYPGAFYDIISVAAFGPDLLPAYYTNYGPGCNIAAPGGEAYHRVNVFKSMVLSTLPSELEELGEIGYAKNQDYGYMQGTSMACPHVSGVVALALSYAKKLGRTFTRDEFKQMILSSVDDIDKRISNTDQKTYAYSHGALKLLPYYHNVGTGAIDTWRLCMKVEGTGCLTAVTDTKQWLDLTDAFGTSSVSLTYLSVDVPQTTIDALGLQKLTPEVYSGTNGTPIPNEQCYAYEQFGRLYIHPTKIGSGKITVNAIGGGDHLGGGDNAPGGYEISTEVSIIARNGGGGNGVGGWL